MQQSMRSYQIKITKDMLVLLLRLENFHVHTVLKDKTKMKLKIIELFPSVQQFQEVIGRHGVTSSNYKARLQQIMNDRRDRRQNPQPQLPIPAQQQPNANNDVTIVLSLIHI